MKTIQEYINHIFSTLPQTTEIERVKEEILSNMEEKYEELKKEGKSENEAIGIVISEFGNIDELIEELHLPTIETDETPISKKAIVEYFHDSKQAFKKINQGIFLILFGIGLSYGLYEILQNKMILNSTATTVLPILGLLFFAIPSLYLFISEGLKIQQLNKIKVLHSPLSQEAKTYLHHEYDVFKPAFIRGIVLGVSLVLCSLITLFFLKGSSDFTKTIGIFICLMIIAIATMIFTHVGTYYSDLQFFLETKAYMEENAEVERVLGAVAAFVFPITFLCSLLAIILYQKWLLALLIFVVVALVYSSFAGAYATFKKK